MGHCYDTRTGQLVCDICGAHPAKKYKCPFGYCQSIAACEKCHTENKDLFTKKHHRAKGCEKHKNEMIERAAEHTRLLAEGKFVRRAATMADQPDGTRCVHVLFEGPGGIYRAFYMSHATYDALPLLENHTIEDYMVYGVVVPAPAWNTPTKEVFFT